MVSLYNKKNILNALKSANLLVYCTCHKRAQFGDTKGLDMAN
jgi:hypothetical protein